MTSPVPVALCVLFLVAATVWVWQHGASGAREASAGAGTDADIRGFEDLRREAAEEQSRGADRAGEPSGAPGGENATDDAGSGDEAEPTDDGGADDGDGDGSGDGDDGAAEPDQPEGTVVPPSDVTDDEASGGEPAAPESSLPGGFAPVPGCDASIPAEGAAENGQLGAEHLCDVGDGFLLRPDAAAAFLAMAERYADSTGESLVSCIGNSYRSYDEQVTLYARKPSLAALPGTSQHGWGLAIDFECGANSYTSSFHEWLLENGREFGWINPPWARPTGSRPEPWHWEFEPSQLG